MLRLTLAEVVCCKSYTDFRTWELLHSPRTSTLVGVSAQTALRTRCFAQAACLLLAAVMSGSSIASARAKPPLARPCMVCSDVRPLLPAACKRGTPGSFETARMPDDYTPNAGFDQACEPGHVTKPSQFSVVSAATEDAKQLRA